jgi:uncharacterized membrane protein YhhN
VLETFVVATAACVAALLVAELAGSRAAVWAVKPLASAGFIAAALAAGALQSAYGQAVLLALGLSWLGDVFLIPRSRRLFLAGLVSFLLGHLAFLGAFVVRGVHPGWMAAGLVLVVPSAFVHVWLRPHLPAGLRAPVLAYMAVITVMAAGALGTYGAWGCAVIPAAAAAFYVSDLAVARDAFVKPGVSNRLWGLPLYYGAQLLFATSVRC